MTSVDASMNASAVVIDNCADADAVVARNFDICADAVAVVASKTDTHAHALHAAVEKGVTSAEPWSTP